LSEFCVYQHGSWKLNKAARFKAEDMIRRAVNQFRAHDSDPVLMGRSEAAYDALRICPLTPGEVLQDIATGE
jgi:hypothetical protein